ncbi:MAG: SRPBCC domain-containing protein [Caldilineaceae bacterium]|nr:SRPBCC domain-containing protein [Caldilineaceae bacterium]MCB0096139.1 SRPBCC domain-containing protein [Caldilineaceae bacterium]
MWTDPDQVKQWYGPTGFTVPVANMDVRVGGQAPDLYGIA